MKSRIAQYLASCGLGSRRKCEELITDGYIKVNGAAIHSPALNIDPAVDCIEYNGKIVTPDIKIYFLLYKPTGFTTTTSDSHAKKLITELVPGDISVWPVGRLDRETAGLIIMTNDGDLTQRLTHPKYEKSKGYLVTVDRPLSDKQLTELRQGITLTDGPIKPDDLKILEGGKYEITIHEGRNRLVRRTFEYFDRRIIALTRTKLAFLEIGNLTPGQYRELTEREIEKLKA